MDKREKLGLQKISKRVTELLEERETENIYRLFKNKKLVNNSGIEAIMCNTSMSDLGKIITVQILPDAKTQKGNSESLIIPLDNLAKYKHINFSIDEGKPILKSKQKITGFKTINKALDLLIQKLDNELLMLLLSATFM